MFAQQHTWADKQVVEMLVDNSPQQMLAVVRHLFRQRMDQLKDERAALKPVGVEQPRIALGSQTASGADVVELGAAWRVHAPDITDQDPLAQSLLPPTA